MNDIMREYKRAELNEAAFIVEDGGTRQFQLKNGLGICALRVVPDHDALVVHLLADQIMKVFGINIQRSGPL